MSLCLHRCVCGRSERRRSWRDSLYRRLWSRRVPSSRQRLITWAKSALHCQILIALPRIKSKIVGIFPPFKSWFWRQQCVGRFFTLSCHFCPMSTRGRLVSDLQAHSVLLGGAFTAWRSAKSWELSHNPSRPVSDIQAHRASFSRAFTAWRSARRWTCIQCYSCERTLNCLNLIGQIQYRIPDPYEKCM